jgi:hypothetical protein
MKNIKYLITIVLFAATVFAANAVKKETALKYHYTYTTTCGTYHSRTETRQLTAGEIGIWHITCEFFGGCL